MPHKSFSSALISKRKVCTLLMLVATGTLVLANKSFLGKSPSESVQAELKSSFLGCQMCKVGMVGFDSVFKSRSTEDMIESVADTVCADFVMKTNSTVCHGAVKEMGDIIVPVLTESYLDPEYFCSQFLGECATSYYQFQPEDYVNQLLATKPDFIKDNEQTL